MTPNRSLVGPDSAANESFTTEPPSSGPIVSAVGRRKLRIQFFRMGLGAPDIRSRFEGIYRCQFRGLEQAGASVLFEEGGPASDIDVSITVPSNRLQENIRLLLKRTDAPIVLYVPTREHFFPHRLLRRASGRIALAYGTFRSEVTRDAYESVGIPYLTMPFGADPDLMRPLALEPQFDVVFVGGLDHRQGGVEYITALAQRVHLDQCLFVGSGFDKFGVARQQVAYGPAINVLYNLGRVCVNFHSTEQKQGARLRSDLNNRVFDLAMAGRAQVCDHPAAVRECFPGDEIAVAEDPQEWAGLVAGLLAMPSTARDDLGSRARAVALASHTWCHRGQVFLEHLRGVIDGTP